MCKSAPGWMVRWTCVAISSAIVKLIAQQATRRGTGGAQMATTKQKAAARENTKKAVAVSSGARLSESRHPMSAAVKKELEDVAFAFPRKP